ncbi:MAG: lysine--tRNA ligase [Hyphomicrobiaceae bacterium]|nr:lysine--tRNA ligase [Hyphomicrobiaceae bacterium]
MKVSDIESGCYPSAQLAKTLRSWPFEEARRLAKRLDRLPEPFNGTVVFETGYGPSGLPHIGTFAEVVRTSMVRDSFEVLTGGRYKSRLICFSDDMDGFRKVPENVPNQKNLEAHLGKPLTSVPDPYSEYESFAHHNNSKLRSFLDQFGFKYEFFSATDCYKSGMMDEILLKMLSVYDEVMNIILPTVGVERQQTYSPFMPICTRTGKVLQVPMVRCDSSAGTITYKDTETSRNVEVPVTGGHVKCQWKADWAVRWMALGVDYEMSGKDLIDSVLLSSKICRALGGTPPQGFSYELFLDEKGEKISKSKGNGLTIEEWLKYASPESLAFYVFQKPKTAKKLYFDVIPKAVDEYLVSLARYSEIDWEERFDSPIWHIHKDAPPMAHVPVSFNLLLNLVSASNAHDKDVLWGFIQRIFKDATPNINPVLDQMVGYAIQYYNTFVKPKKVFRSPDEAERLALVILEKKLFEYAACPGEISLQQIVYDAGRAGGFQDNMRGWFKAIYEVLLGQPQGPRFGSFIELYGIEETRKLIIKKLSK